MQTHLGWLCCYVWRCLRVCNKIEAFSIRREPYFRRISLPVSPGWSVDALKFVRAISMSRMDSVRAVSLFRVVSLPRLCLRTEHSKDTQSSEFFILKYFGMVFPSAKKVSFKNRTSVPLLKIKVIEIIANFLWFIQNALYVICYFLSLRILSGSWIRFICHLFKTSNFIQVLLIYNVILVLSAQHSDSTLTCLTDHPIRLVPICHCT